MSELRKLGLSLKEEGWVRVDAASTSVHGIGEAEREAERIVREMQQVIDDDVVISLCDRLGICSTAFLFHDSLRNETRFYRTNEVPPTYRTRYLWSVGAVEGHWDELIQWLFVHVREAQYGLRRAGDVRAEDYFVNVPADEDEWRALPAEVFRKKYNVHYCTVGEVLFTCFAWRFLGATRDRGLISAPVKEAILGLDDEVSTESVCYWLGDQLRPIKGVSHELEAIVSAFMKLWGNAIGPQGVWGEEWAALLLSGDDKATNRNAVLQFLYQVEIGPAPETVDVDDDEAINTILQNAVFAFLQWLDPEFEANTVEQAVLALERSARFPVLPFYVWNALNRSPVCYAVVPIWTSQHHSVKVPSGQCRHLGLALTGLRPVSEWDWSLTSDGQPDGDIEPLVFINFLRLMARPLVESNLYEHLFREVRKTTEELVQEEIEARLKGSESRRGEVDGRGEIA